MATTKKTNPKSMDVHPPESTAADSTARPLIVSNRAMMQDPMMRPDGAQAEPTTSPLLEKPTAKPERTLSAARTKLDIKTPTNKDQADTALQDKTSADAVPVQPEPKQTPEPAAQPTEDLPKDVADASKASVHDSSTDKDTPIMVEDAHTKETTPGTDRINQPEPEPKTDDTSGAVDEPGQDSDAKQKAEAAEFEAAEQERVEHIRTLIDEKTYFVATSRQGKQRSGWLLLFLLVVMAGAAAAFYVFSMSAK